MTLMPSSALLAALAHISPTTQHWHRISTQDSANKDAPIATT